MSLKLTSGVNNKPLLITIYGTDHTGKSTVGSKFPNPIFIDIEKGTDLLNVNRYQPSNFDEVLEILRSLYSDTQGFETIVIDTIDWVEKMADKKICLDNNVSSLGDLAWGTGIRKQKDLMLSIIDSLCAISQHTRMGVVILGHAKQKRFDDPEQEHAYDRYHMAINGDVFDKIRERSDAVFFVCKDIKVVVDQGNKMLKPKGISTGKVLCHTGESAGFYAKNRFEMPPFFEFNYDNIKSCIDVFFEGNLTKVNEVKDGI